MVQVFSPSPRAMQAGQIGQAFGTGLSKQLGLAEAENAFQNSQGDPLKLATAMARMGMVDPSLEKAIGPMYSAMLNQMRGKEMLGAQTAAPSQYIPQQEIGAEQALGDKAPSITEREPLEETRKPYLPREYGQIVKDAQKNFPTLFVQDTKEAIDQELKIENQRLSRSQALQQQRVNQEGIESNIKGKLRDQIKTLGIEPGGVAGNLFSKIEDKAIRSILPPSEGGEGLTEQQASKKYGKEIEDAARDYNVIKSWGGTYTMGPWNAKNVKRQIDSTRNQFKNRGDLENFSDLLVAENGLSPMTASYFAFPVSENPAVKKELDKIPEFKKYLGAPNKKASTNITSIFPSLAKSLDKNSSILSIAQEMRNKGYDPQLWLEYVTKNRDSLDLTERQGRELSKNISTIPNLSDLWMLTVGK